MDNNTAVWILFSEVRTSLDSSVKLRSLKSDIKSGDTVYVYGMAAGKILYRTTVTEIGEGARYNLLQLHIDERYLGKGLRSFDNLPSEPMDKALMEITENSPLLKHIQSEFEEGQARFQVRKEARESRSKKTPEEDSDWSTILLIIVIIGTPILIFMLDRLFFGIIMFIGLIAILYQELTRGKL